MLSQSFTGPSDGICPGDNITFTCVVYAAVTVWTVNPGGESANCNYRQSMPNVTAMCGPEGRFTSSQTDENGDTNNSSLSVVSITNDLNGTSVTCSDGNLNLIGSSTICIIGRNNDYQCIRLQLNHPQILSPLILNLSQPLSQREMWEEEKSVW